jgi:1,4-dihydroxy-6-naphthoate synthase
LGQYWEEKTHLPIPLGGIAIKRSLPDELKMQVEDAIRNSIENAHLRSEPITPFIASHAQEMDPEVMKKHIQLYVNDYSLQIGEKGKAGILAMQKILAPHFKQSIFIH